MSVKTVADRIRARHRPTGNVHQPEWEGRYIGGSTIVKLTAADYALRILAQKRGEVAPTSGNKFWSYKGNTLAGGSLADADCSEVHAEIGLSVAGWRLVIHPDAVSVVDDKVVVQEHKSHGTPSTAKIESAKRQAMLGLAAMWWEAHAAFSERPDREVYVFPVAAWHPDQTAHFDWLRSYVPDGVVVVVVPDQPLDGNNGERGGDPTIIREFPMTMEQVQEILDFYVSKAMAIASAVEADDPEIAAAWDKEHPTEYLRDFEELADGTGDLATNLAAYHKLAKIADEAIDEKRRIGELICIEIQDKQAKKQGVAGGWTATVVNRDNDQYADIKALREAGLDGFIRTKKPYRYPLVRGVAEVEA